nr:hypothetical protein StreXyl84_74120 [Streptomyces sp. Xyl84]
MVPPGRLTAVAASTLVPAGAFTETVEQVGEVEAGLPVAAEAPAGRYTAAASGTPAARTVRSRLMTFLS